MCDLYFFNVFLLKNILSVGYVKSLPLQYNQRMRY